MEDYHPAFAVARVQTTEPPLTATYGGYWRLADGVREDRCDQCGTEGWSKTADVDAAHRLAVDEGLPLACFCAACEYDRGLHN